VYISSAVLLSLLFFCDVQNPFDDDKNVGAKISISSESGDYMELEFFE